MVAQRPITAVSSQAVSISKVFTQPIENPQSTQQTANIFIHAPIAAVPRKPSPGTSDLIEII